MSNYLAVRLLIDLDDRDENPILEALLNASCKKHDADVACKVLVLDCHVTPEIELAQEWLGSERSYDG